MGNGDPDPTVKFKLALLGVAIITALCLVLAVVISSFSHPSDIAKDTADKLMSLATLGLGAFIGLVGGKVAS
jgi:hypothetical protein